MTSTAIIATAARAGVSLSVERGVVYASPTGMLSTALRGEVQAHKAEVIALIRQRTRAVARAQRCLDKRWCAACAEPGNAAFMLVAASGELLCRSCNGAAMRAPRGWMSAVLLPTGDAA